MRYFEDFHVGQVDRFDETYLVTEEEIREVGERWDPQPFHTDPAAAASSIFGGLVASTVHLFAIVWLLGQKAERVAAVTNLGLRSIENHAPVRPGDVLSCHGTVLEARLSKSRPGLGVVTTRGELRNQREELVFSLETVALVECHPAT